MRVVDLREKERWLEAQQKELGLSAADFVAARNSGRRRTPEKRALLQRLAEDAERQGKPVAFPANF